MSDGCQNYDRGQQGPRKPKSKPPVRVQPLVMPWELSFCLNITKHESFDAAFRTLYEKMMAEPMCEQLLETVWIKHDGHPLPMMFYEARAEAYARGLLCAGKPTWQNAQAQPRAGRK
jgi:hypothetical protein